MLNRLRTKPQGPVTKKETPGTPGALVISQLSVTDIKNEEVYYFISEKELSILCLAIPKALLFTKLKVISPV
jgi:hypothetical protein